MKADAITGEALWTAFGNLSRKERDVFLGKMRLGRRLCEDLIDITIAGRRFKDKARVFREIKGA